ncbi:hypothetical protein GYMLUDRAFT_163862 [Collybiopsis luxurians FD-317 M1]|uniref:Store-operated calcium entry-associated regulatory factor n=1 Tax=Collybiopsis luxurians FD-317 M1 TaxID=944289 RepID=A0A0D0D1K6_9AGAR|nr:hypothetical protein GYMLUDRAFT_163862 [Collybiopsis luxurians FD-317 M1]
MSRVKLASINSLNFYQDELTAARRTSALPQLVCVGKPCRRYQPEVVHCKNIGGTGIDVDWKASISKNPGCEADLPEALRFGKVTVSCEGWSGPGDPYVLKDSCSLEYRLVEVPRDLRNEPNHHGAPPMDITTIIFTIIWVAVLLFICYSFLKSCLAGRSTSDSGTARNNRPGGGTPGGSGWFPGNYDDHSSGDTPPPYSKNASNNQQQNEGWRPGFWTGALLGGLADRYLMRNNEVPRRQYDWEQSRRPTTSFFNGGGGGNRRVWSSNSEDRGEGPSNSGSMRQSTGFGGSNVR